MEKYTLLRWPRKEKLVKRRQSKSYIVNKKRGRPVLLGCDLDRQVRAYLTALRSNGAVVNTAIAIACAEGIIKNVDSNLLECNGGHIRLTESWATSNHRSNRVAIPTRTHDS